MGARFKPTIAVQVLHVLWVICALSVSVELVRRAIPMYLPRDWANAHEFDAIEDWKAARAVFLGFNPYSKQGMAAIGQPAMGHPPSTPFWYLAIAEFSKAVAVQLSTFLVWFLLPLHTYLCSKALKFPTPVLTALLAASALFACTFVKYHCDATQFSEPIAFLYVLSWWFLRQGRDARAGIFVGAALSMKLFPGLMLVLFLVARRFRAFAAGALTYLAIALVMTRAYGLASWTQFFEQQGGVSAQWLGAIQNGSLQGLVVQLITPACVAQGKPSALASSISLFASLLLLGLAIWLSRSRLRDARERDPRAIDLPFALFALLSVFLNPWVWNHYAVLVVQPLFVIVACFGRRFGSAFRDWCEEVSSTASLMRAGAVTGVAALGVALTLRALSEDSQQLIDMSNLWQAYHFPAYHHLLHFLQVENFAIWVVPLLLCFFALALGRSSPQLPSAV